MDESPSLADIGVSYKLSSHAQKVAAIQGAALSISLCANRGKDRLAEPLTLEQIAETLDRISHLATSLALGEMQATREEWYAANDAIQ